jgi:hypothetical protein
MPSHGDHSNPRNVTPHVDLPTRNVTRKSSQSLAKSLRSTIRLGPTCWNLRYVTRFVHFYFHVLCKFHTPQRPPTAHTIWINTKTKNGSKIQLQDAKLERITLNVEPFFRVQIMCNLTSLEEHKSSSSSSSSSS